MAREIIDETVQEVIHGIEDRAWGKQDQSIYRPIPLQQVLTLEDWRDLERLNDLFGQKVLYQELVDHYGKEETIKILSRVVSEKIVRIQVSMLTTDKSTNV
ncbi:hypothetical protein HY004_02440 [Candidatus Saccharibacteria bacterium]|nr:hypothetical protein [Candidatus Saccharibacteria bacterium]